MFLLMESDAMLSDVAEMANSSRRPARPATADVALACLAGKPLSARFSAWRGVSGARYICTIYPVDGTQPQDGLPPYLGMIVLAVQVGPDGSRAIVAVSEVGVDSVEPRRAAGHEIADEWHVHLMAEAPAERAAVLRDLLASF
jgi:hypothetical protein